MVLARFACAYSGCAVHAHIRVLPILPTERLGLMIMDGHGHNRKIHILQQLLYYAGLCFVSRETRLAIIF